MSNSKRNLPQDNEITTETIRNRAPFTSVDLESEPAYEARLQTLKVMHAYLHGCCIGLLQFHQARWNLSDERATARSAVSLFREADMLVELIQGVEAEQKALNRARIDYLTAQRESAARERERTLAGTDVIALARSTKTKDD